MPAITPMLQLIPLAGPRPVRPLLLDHTLSIGRAPGAALLLVDTRVSRQHARIEVTPEGLLLRDLGSQLGTELNGGRMEGGSCHPLRAGDRVGIGPWLFEVAVATDTVQREELQLDEDAPTGIQLLPGSEASADIAAFAQFASRAAACRSLDQLDRLLLAEVRRHGVLDAAVLLEPGAGSGVRVACADPPTAWPEGLTRALLDRADAGGVLLLPPAAAISPVHTQVGIGPAWCVCVALRGEHGSEAWLYGWRRDVRPPGAELGHYLRGLAELAQALRTGLRQRALAEQHAQLAADLAEARVVQHRLLPAANGSCAGLRYARIFRPGREVSGDLLLLMPDEAGGCGFALGDVSGSGAGAALLMAQLCGLLQGSLPTRMPLADVAAQLNRALLQIGEGRFASMVLGRFHPRRADVELLDAGHGFACMAVQEGKLASIELPGGPPLGVIEQSYLGAQLSFPPGSRLLLISDGVAELGRSDGTDFGIERTTAAVEDDPDCGLAGLAAALDAWHDPLSAPDDASALLLMRE